MYCLLFAMLVIGYFSAFNVKKDDAYLRCCIIGLQHRYLNIFGFQIDAHSMIPKSRIQLLGRKTLDSK